MPELPDIEAYIAALTPRLKGRTVTGIRLASPFLLRTVTPPAAAFAGRTVIGIRRMGKRIMLAFDGGHWLVLHLMIAGRLHWRPAGAPIPGGKQGLAAIDTADGSLALTEAGSKKRAALHLFTDADALAALDPGGLEVLEADAAGFAAVLCRTNHTCKRALTDPRLFSGIGNAYSDEILHRARLSPAALTQSLDDPDIARLHAAVRDVLTEWRDRLVGEAEDRFPEKVTAFRPEMAVHGRYGKPCPACGTAVQRIKYASNECNYCPRCQTGGRLLADRYFSTLLGKDWPRSIEALERTGAGS